MAPSLFISYSRREAPFVDSLYDVLDDLGLRVWLDYHSLVPARVWAEQIEEGLQRADVVLLIISKESLASKYATQEWQRAAELQKRIILVIFEAVPLPDALLKYEWVDLRGSFNKGVNDLISVIENPARMTAPPPQTGFRAPRMVWVAIVLSVCVALLSLPTLWSLYIPFYLLPLPYHILKRNFNYFRVELALFHLPLTLFFAALFFGDYLEFFFILFLVSLVLVPILIFLLRSSAMHRWAKPIATRGKFANPLVSPEPQSQPARFFIDYAPEDKKYADEMIKVLKKYGHQSSENHQGCQAAFVLISRYKHTTILDPEVANVYPVILQFNPDIDPKLERVQWIDFRRGLKHLDKLALLLNEPEKMLKALSICPPGEQIVVPLIVRMLIYFFVLTAIFSVGGWLAVLSQTWDDLSQSERLAEVVLWFIVVLGGILSLAFSSINSLIHRKGRSASIFGLGLTILLLGILNVMQFALVGGMMEFIPGFDENDTRTLGGAFGTFAYFGGLISVTLLALWFWKDLLRWFPEKTRQVKSAV